MSEWILHFDGLVEPRNPGGNLVWAWVLIDQDGVVESGSGFVAAKPGNTNNIAEYWALGFALKAVLKKLEIAKPPDQLTVRGDSMLVVNQVMQRWQCKKEHLRNLRDRILELTRQITMHIVGIQGIVIEWVPRDQNAIADDVGRKTYQQHTGRMPPERSKR